jgi:hypothetical protein
VSKLATAIITDRDVVDVGDAVDVNATPIESIKPMPFSGMTRPLSTTEPIVLVLVEARLLDPLPPPAATASSLQDGLQAFHDDLRADGLDARSLLVRMRRGAGHRDGEGVLALRELFQDLYASHPNFAGVVLVGSFPEAMLVRRWIWKKTDQTLALAGQNHQHVDLLYLEPEVIAERSDLVLADLDGAWDQIYEPGPVNLDGIRAIPDAAMGTWPTDGGLFTSSIFERTPRSFQDFFWIRDDDVSDLTSPGANNLVLRVWTTNRNPECAPADLGQPNAIARPEIAVSRINPCNVAVLPDPSFSDVAGKGFLDATGQPQEVEAGAIVADIWTQDRNFERRLLIDYFDRNHKFRRGDHFFSTFRAAAVGSSAFDSGWASATGLAAALGKASTSFQPPEVLERSTVLEFVKWIKKPATFRGFAVHANKTFTGFDPVDYQVADLEAELGGPPWRWRVTSIGKTVTYTPSLADQGDRADLHLYRSLWEHGALASSGPCFLLHNGCHVNSPSGARKTPYDSDTYAPFQEAESQLFYLNGLAIVARAKEFSDWVSRDFPHGFGAADARFGDGLKAYFTADAADAHLGSFANSVGAKRTYWWSLLGDWTLRLRYAPKPVVAFKKPLAAVRPLLRNRWLVTDGFELVRVIEGEDLARRAVEVIDHYGMTERYVIGDEEDGWEYYLADGEVPRPIVRMPFREARIDLDGVELTIDRVRGRWLVLVGRQPIASLATRLDAEAVVSVLHHHEAAAVCWVGDRDAPALRYFTAAG